MRKSIVECREGNNWRSLSGVLCCDRRMNVYTFHGIKILTKTTVKLLPTFSTQQLEDINNKIARSVHNVINHLPLWSVNHSWL